jgi:hypothetical protein
VTQVSTAVFSSSIAVVAADASTPWLPPTATTTEFVLITASDSPAGAPATGLPRTLPTAELFRPPLDLFRPTTDAPRTVPFGGVRFERLPAGTPAPFDRPGNRAAQFELLLETVDRSSPRAVRFDSPGERIDEVWKRLRRSRPADSPAGVSAGVSAKPSSESPVADPFAGDL